jgi:hypothetical protein
MDSNDRQQGETQCPGSSSQVPPPAQALRNNIVNSIGAETLERKVKEAEICHFNAQPTVHTFRQWWLHMKKEVAKASGGPDIGYAWISKVEITEDPEDLQESDGKRLLDAKVAVGFAKVLHGDLAKQVQLFKEKAEACKKLLKGRQISWYIKDYFRINAEQGARSCS